MTKIFMNVLLAEQPDRDLAALTVDNIGAKDPLALEDALRVVPEHPVAEIGHELLAGVEPVVQGQIVFGGAAPLAG